MSKRNLVKKNQERCRIVDNELGRLGQYIIYFFNELPIRMQKSLKMQSKNIKKMINFVILEHGI